VNVRARDRLDPSPDIDGLRAAVGLIADASRRARLLHDLDELDDRRRGDTFDELRATDAVGPLRHELADARAAADAAEHRAELLAAELGAARRELRACESQLAELRGMITEGLADRLLEVAARVEAQLPTSPPLLSVRRAAALTRAVEATRSAPG
jgi:chromosome segregation ATPase